MTQRSNSKESDHGDTKKTPDRVTAVCAILGGSLLTTLALIMVTLPEGLPDGPYRDAGILYGVLFLPGMICITGAALGLYFLHPTGGSAVKVVRIAALVAGTSFFFGTTVLIGAWYAGAILIYVSIFAFVVTGIAILEARTLPTWAGGLLAIGSLLLLGFNTEDSRVLFLVPFGVSWAILGVLLLAGKFNRFGRLSETQSTARSRNRDL